MPLIEPTCGGAMPRVSVIIPVYNGASTIATAIESALSQTLDDIEIIVIDDASTDSTSEVLGSFGARIRVVTQPGNEGASAARNAAGAVARGEYLAFLDADDCWMPDKLAKTIAALDRNSSAVLAFSDYVPVNSEGERFTPSSAGRAPSMKELLSGGWDIILSTIIIRKKVFDLVGGFPTTLPFGFEDPYLLRRAREYGEFEYIAEPLIFYRLDPFAVRTTRYDGGRREFMRLVRARYGRAAAGLIVEVKRATAAGLVQAALQQIDDGDRGRAFMTLLRVLRVRPSYLLDSALVRRLFAPRNVGRLLKVLGIERADVSRRSLT